MNARPLNTLRDIVALAIDREKEAAAGYRQLAGIVETPGLRVLALELEQEEIHHRELLENLRSETWEHHNSSPVADLGLSDALVDEALSPDMTVQDLLLFAAKKEKRATELYAGLARAADARPLRELFDFLADQERVHKLKIETEYERIVLKEN